MKQDERAGLLFALAGFAALSCGDAIIKTLADEWSPLAVAALRYTIGALGLCVLLARRQGARAFRPKRPWLQLARGLCMAVATLCFFSAIFLMPLAEATAMIFVAPIITALLSGPLLAERVPPGTWAASLAAFFGMVLVLRPNLLELGWAALLPLVSALFMSLFMIANRAVARDGSALSMQVFVAASAAPILVGAAILGQISGIGSLQIGWPDWTIIARCILVAITASTAHWLVYLGTTRAGAATIAPMTYIQLLVAIALGWILFGDIPDLATLSGSAIIIGAGLYLWHRGGQREVPIAD